jgi:hypothetical protein
MATYTGFVRDTLVLKDMIPIHRSGGVLWLCNYSTAPRVAHLDWSENGVVWTEQNLTAGARQKSGLGVIVQPYGVVGAGFILPDDNIDAKFIRVRLDDTADGDGVFVQLETAAPVPDHPLM